MFQQLKHHLAYFVLSVFNPSYLTPGCSDDDPADEPTSSSTDLQACYVPACSVVSSSQACTMATLTSTSVSPTLSAISPFVRLRSQDCSESHSPTLNTERARPIYCVFSSMLGLKLPEAIASVLCQNDKWLCNA